MNLSAELPGKDNTFLIRVKSVKGVGLPLLTRTQNHGNVTDLSKTMRWTLHTHKKKDIRNERDIYNHCIRFG